MIEITEEILRINEKIKTLNPSQIIQSSSRELFYIFRRLDEIVALEIAEEELKELEKNEEFIGAIQNIASFRRWYGLKLELQQTRALLKEKDPWNKIREFVFYPNYVKLAEMEFYGASLKKGDVVAFVGSGPLPMSLIMLASLWDVRGIGIEKEKEYSHLSSALISHLELAHKIQIITGDHSLVPSLDMEISLYMIASAAYPKDEIFSLLGSTLPPGSLVSYRTYEKGLRRLFSDTNITLPAPFKEIARIHPSPPVNNTVVILKKIR